VRRRVVDSLAEQAGGHDAARIAEPRTMQRGAHDELAHVTAGGEPLELGHALGGIGRSVSDLDASERLQAVGVDPDVGIGHPYRADCRVAQARQRRRPLAGRLVDQTRLSPRYRPPDQPPSEFDELVMQALDDLPERFRELLERTPVTVSSRGHEHRAYGHYIGGTIARDTYPDRIVIYKDTLECDFGHDPELLRAQVERTVRHELAHHLGWDERGVRGLGL